MVAYFSVRRSTLRSATCIYHPLPRPWWYQSSFALRQRHRILWRTPNLRHKNGRRPTLPRSLPRSTIGAGGLNFSVRNGKRCIPAAIVTLSKKRQVFGCMARALARLAFENRIARSQKNHQALDLLVPLGYIHRCTYTCGLSTWWSTRSLTPSKVMGDLISRRASRLDAFSGYPFRT